MEVYSLTNESITWRITESEDHEDGYLPVQSYRVSYRRKSLGGGNEEEGLNPLLLVKNGSEPQNYTAAASSYRRAAHDEEENSYHLPKGII